MNITVIVISACMRLNARKSLSFTFGSEIYYTYHEVLNAIKLNRKASLLFARLTCFKRRFIKNERAKTILLIMLKYLLERFIDRATSSAI